jgi:hypothetical protein
MINFLRSIVGPANSLSFLSLEIELILLLGLLPLYKLFSIWVSRACFGRKLGNWEVVGMVLG